MRTSLIIVFCFISHVTMAQQLAWLVQSGGPNMDLARDLVLDKDGNSYTTGSVGTTAIFGDVPFESDQLPIGGKGYLQKVNPDGALEWFFVLDGPGSCEGINLATDISGNIYVVGTFSGSIDFDPDSTTEFIMETEASYRLFVLKVDANMDFIWAFSLDGNIEYLEADVTLDAHENIYLGGLYNDSLDVDPSDQEFWLPRYGSTDIFYAKYNSFGDFIWAKAMGSSRNDALLEMTYDQHSGSIVSTGYFREQIAETSDGESVDITSNDSWDVFVQKIDTSGSLEWTKAFGGGSLDVGQAIDTDLDGNIYTGGSFMTAVDFDPGEDVYELTAFTTGSNGLVNDDGFVQKLDSDGAFIWARVLNSVGSVLLYDLTVDGQGNVHTTGNFSGELSSSPVTLNDTIVGGETPFFTSFVATYSEEGMGQQAFAIGGGDPSIDQRIEVSPTNEIILAGNFSETVNFAPMEERLFQSRGILDGYVAKINPQSVSNLELNAGSFTLFPNPANSELNIELSSTFANIKSASIYNSFGVKIYEESNMHDYTIDVGDFPSGMYFFVLESTNQSFVKKWIKD